MVKEESHEDSILRGLVGGEGSPRGELPLNPPARPSGSQTGFGTTLGVGGKKGEREHTRRGGSAERGENSEKSRKRVTTFRSKERFDSAGESKGVYWMARE